MHKKTVVIGLIGPSLDQGMQPTRWERWRPSVSLFQQEELRVDRFEMLFEPRSSKGRGYESLANHLRKDIELVSPETEVCLRPIQFADNPWDFESVYETLFDFASQYPFDPEREDYLLHITTGTHVAQICWFLLCESHIIPARLIQTSPSRKPQGGFGTTQQIDLNLARYDRIAKRFALQQDSATQILKHGIETRNADYNNTIAQIERVATHSRDPMLLTGPTGAGKSFLASRIFDLRRQSQGHNNKGNFVAANCATLRGDSSHSALFGHVRGAFTGAAQARKGLLLEADGGLLFLDEVGELPLDEQAMLLKAIEEKTFYPLGSDKEVKSDFQLICGTNKDLNDEVLAGRFRRDLLSRINLWHFDLPGLKDRREDIEPNIEYELIRVSEKLGHLVRFNVEAKKRYQSFAELPSSTWSGNFRDLAASITRMATMAEAGRITLPLVENEIKRLNQDWSSSIENQQQDDSSLLKTCLGPEQANQVDPFDIPQLAATIRCCQQHSNLSSAGRALFAISRLKRTSTNDGDRLRKYLAKFGLSFADCQI